jgi:hypothetical protein
MSSEVGLENAFKFPHRQRGLLRAYSEVTGSQSIAGVTRFESRLSSESVSFWLAGLTSSVRRPTQLKLGEEHIIDT